MATGLSSPLGISGIILVVIGIIMAIVGVILIVSNQNADKPWYVWFLLIGGIVVGILGGILLAIALSQKEVVVGCGQYVAQPVNTQVPIMVPQEPQQPQSVVYRQPVYQQPKQVLRGNRSPPPPVTASRDYEIDDDTFDPDPTITLRKQSPAPKRIVARGPYGPNGEMVDVTGTYKPKSRVIQEETDYPEHEVEIVGTANKQVNRQVQYMQPQYMGQ